MGKSLRTLFFLQRMRLFVLVGEGGESGSVLLSEKGKPTGRITQLNGRYHFRGGGDHVAFAKNRKTRRFETYSYNFV